MIDHLANLLALRALATSLSVATTGVTTLAATATGYTRAAGSFTADGFAVGMEVVPSGFAANTPGVVTEVTALSLAVDGGRSAEAAAPGRMLVVGLPALRAWENIDFEPELERWYVEEDYVPGPVRTMTVGERGVIEGDPQYVLKLYAPQGRGVTALYGLADGLLRVFAPHTALPLPSGDELRVRGNPAPYRGQLVAREGRALVVVTVPLRVRTLNVI